MKLMQRRL